MRTIQNGLRRLYLAPSCAIPDKQPIFAEKVIGNTTVSILISNEPRFGVSLVEGFHLPFISEIPVQTGPIKIGTPSSQTALAGFNFTEVLCTHSQSIDDAEYELLKSRDQITVGRIISMAHQEENSLGLMAATVVGALGLKVHLNFVKKILSQELIAFDETGFLAGTYSFPVMETLDQISTNEHIKDRIDGLLNDIQMISYDEDSKVHDVMHWLTTSWDERSPQGRFIELFMILEILVGGIGRGECSPSPSATLLRDFISRSQTDQTIALLEALAKLDGNRPPSLAQRFETLAANTPNAAEDIAAFKKFNALRNALVHRGQRGVLTILKVDDEIVADLEDLVERFISYSLWGNFDVYKSFHRLHQT